MAHALSETTIFVADNVSEAKNISQMLRDEAFLKVKTCSDGLAALPQIAREKPKVVIANQILPKYSGIQIFKSMAKDPRLAEEYFILTTPKLNRRELEELKKKDGIPHLLQRPFGAEELRDLIFEMFNISADSAAEAAAYSYQEGLNFFEEGKFTEALEMFREAQDADKKPEYFFMMGRCYLELEDLAPQAVTAFKSAFALDREYPELDYWLGIALQRQEQFEESAKALARAVRIDQNNANKHVDLGKSHLGAGDIDSADKAFATAADKAPGDSDTRANIGNAYLEHGHYEKAEAHLGDAINLNPENIPLYNRMAIALRKQGKHDEAIKLYMKALGIAPADEGLYYNLGRALFESGQKEKAIKSLQKALSLDPEFEEAIVLLERYRQ